MKTPAVISSLMGAPHVDDLRQAHKCSSNHRQQIEASSSCGCFFCLSIYPPSEIEDWTDWPDETPEGSENEQGTTAICPRCGVDSVIGSASGYPVAQGFLQQMKKLWFKGF